VTAAWELAKHGVRVGISAWTEPTLIASHRFYPDDAVSAEARLRFYASVFPVAEVDSTYYAGPSPRNAALWVDRTPPGFRFDVRAFRLLTGHPTPPSSLWGDLRGELSAELAAKPNLYAPQLPHTLLLECLRRFLAALDPLRDAGRLGAVVFPFPRYVYPSNRSFAYIVQLAEELGELRGAVEFGQARWLDETHRDRTLAFLADLGLSYVCVDEPRGFRSSLPPVAAVTTPELALVRLHGRNAAHWERRDLRPSDRHAYDYCDDELAEWVPKVGALRARAAEVHVLANNSHDDDAVRAAARLATQLRAAGLRQGCAA
jgi:uncharacterized protein YecE (DUF72 family)